jgi:hypothetical protein
MSGDTPWEDWLKTRSQAWRPEVRPLTSANMRKKRCCSSGRMERHISAFKSRLAATSLSSLLLRGFTT